MLIIAILFLDKRRSCANLVLQRLDFTSFICVNITGSGSIISGGKAMENGCKKRTWLPISLDVSPDSTDFLVPFVGFLQVFFFIIGFFTSLERK